MARHPYTSVSSAEELNPPVEKKGVLVNTPTLTWAYTKTFKEREKRYSSDIGSFSSQTGC
jgi:hypothetical protein